MRKIFKFNEQSAIENMIKSGFIDENNITNTIYSLAKYNYHVLNLKDRQNYDNILKYVLSKCDNIIEANIYNDIESCIKNAKKHKFVSIQEICITENELEKIKSLDDIKQEKVIFVILAISKYFNALYKENLDRAYLTNSEICKLARITIPVNERNVFMQFLYDKGLVLRHVWSNSTVKQITFVSHDENDVVALKLNEADFKDLAYAYMAHLEPHKFRRCSRCGRLMRKNKYDNRICTECKKETCVEDKKDVLKTVRCVDCGNSVFVSILNSKTCRCEECQYKKNKELNRISSRERMKKYRSNL